MENPKSFISVLVCVLLGSLLFSGCSTGTTENPVDPETGKSEVTTLVMGISDAPPSLGEIESVTVSVSSIGVRHQEEGWKELSFTTPKVFDLLALKEQEQIGILGAFEDIPEGNITQFRLTVDESTLVDQEGEQLIKIPSNTLRFMHTTEVESGKDMLLNFDFLINESLHVTGNGRYIMTPVVEFKTGELPEEGRRALEEGRRQIPQSGMTATERVKVGMDLGGEMAINNQVPMHTNLTVRNGSVMVPGNNNPGMESEVPDRLPPPSSGKPQNR